MKKLFYLLSLTLILGFANSAFAEVGYVDYSYISKNYPLAQKYRANLKAKGESIRTYAADKDKQIEKLKTTEEKESTKKAAIEQVKIKQDEYKKQKAQYENELNSKVEAAAEKIRVQKNLDIIIKKDTRITGGVDCTQEVLSILKSSK